MRMKKKLLMNLDDLLQESSVSSAIGWAIQFANKIKESKHHVSEVKMKLRITCPWLHCNSQNLALLLFILEQVASLVGSSFHHLLHGMYYVATT